MMSVNPTTLSNFDPSDRTSFFNDRTTTGDVEDDDEEEDEEDEDEEEDKEDEDEDIDMLTPANTEYDSGTTEVKTKSELKKLWNLTFQS
jgi:hypothetical protein